MMASLSDTGGGGEGGADYFNSYCDLSVHELMLRDRPRTTFYRKFFETHRDFVRGKVVMDVGAGTGILSLFAASAGAKTVYAVEASEVASLCEEIVKENNLESVIKVIHGAVEEISLPDNVKVDIIVSEWMGFYLLHESMLDSVLFAADKFLSPDGVLVPSRASIYMAPVDMSDHFQDRADYWSNIYGYDFSPIASTMNLQEVSKPLVNTIPESYVKAKAVRILDLELKTTKVSDVKSFSKLCKFPMSEESRIHGFVTWFDVSFDLELDSSPSSISSMSSKSNDSVTMTTRCVDDNHLKVMDNQQTSLVDSSGDASASLSNNNLKDKDNNKSICCKNSNNKSKELDSSSSAVTTDVNSTLSSVFSLSTGPASPPTHWKQTIVFLPHTIMVMEGIVLCCKVKMSQDSENNKRHYNISLELKEDVIDLDNNGVDSGEVENSSDGDNDDDDCADSDDSCDHPVPCDCGSNRCRLIAALVVKYDTEHQELEDEAVMMETEAEVEAAKEIDSAIEKEGWSLDTSGADGV